MRAKNKHKPIPHISWVPPTSEKKALFKDLLTITVPFPPTMRPCFLGRMASKGVGPLDFHAAGHGTWSSPIWGSPFMLGQKPGSKIHYFCSACGGFPKKQDHHLKHACMILPALSISGFKPYESYFRICYMNPLKYQQKTSGFPSFWNPKGDV